MPANYMYRTIDKIGSKGTLKRAYDKIYDEKLHIAINILYKDFDLYYLPIPAKEVNRLLPEGYVKGVDTAIWVDPDLSIGIREGFDPDVVILVTGITFRVDVVDKLGVLNHNYKTVILKKIESGLT